MSLVLNLPGKGMPNNIYMIYNFSQIKDEILLVMYVDKCKSWKKISVGYNNGYWQTNTLIKYTDVKTFNEIQYRLKKIFNQHTHLNKHDGLHEAELLPEHAALFIGACS